MSIKKPIKNVQVVIIGATKVTHALIILMILDLVIGAPYQDEGGAVYIYHGSTNGLSEKPVQV